MVSTTPVHLRRAIVTLLLTAALVPVLGGGVDAAPPRLLHCEAAGTVQTTPGVPDTWTLGGKGSCFGDGEGTYFVDFVGAGTSSGLGLCGNGEQFTVTDFFIRVTMTLQNAETGLTKLIQQSWDAPVTTYPHTTPFIVEQDVPFVGAGAFWNHIWFNCAGTSVATFIWDTLLPGAPLR